MRRAASRLVRSDESRSRAETSHNCGFDDPNYFAEAFRKRYGASPTEFRATGMYSAKSPH